MRGEKKKYFFLGLNIRLKIRKENSGLRVLDNSTERQSKQNKKAMNVNWQVFDIWDSGFIVKIS